jgi:hypothetical protein
MKGCQMTQGIRCNKKGTTPVLGSWDYDGHDGGGDTMSVAVFQWISTADGKGVKRGKSVKRFRDSPKGEASLHQKAEDLCESLETEPSIPHCTDPHVRINVAAASTTPTGALSALSSDEDVRVRIKVARHRNTDPWILEQLSKDSDPKVRAAVARNPNTRLQVLSELMKDGIGSVACAAWDSNKIRQRSNDEVSANSVSTTSAGSELW